MQAYLIILVSRLYLQYYKKIYFCKQHIEQKSFIFQGHKRNSPKVVEQCLLHHCFMGESPILFKGGIDKNIMCTI